MKYLLLSFLLFFPFCSKSEEFSIEIFDYQKYFEIQLKSKKHFGSCSYLKPSELYIEAANDSFAGCISIEIDQDPNILPLNKPGPNLGCLQFVKGICLPQINKGQYQLIINNEYYGILFVESNKTYLKSIYEVNYIIK